MEYHLGYDTRLLDLYDAVIIREPVCLQNTIINEAQKPSKNIMGIVTSPSATPLHPEQSQVTIQALHHALHLLKSPDATLVRLDVLRQPAKTHEVFLTPRTIVYPVLMLWALEMGVQGVKSYKVLHRCGPSGLWLASDSDGGATYPMAQEALVRRAVPRPLRSPRRRGCRWLI